MILPQILKAKPLQPHILQNNFSRSSRSIYEKQTFSGKRSHISTEAKLSKNKTKKRNKIVQKFVFFFVSSNSSILAIFIDTCNIVLTEYTHKIMLS
jgi:hypothetical protein